MPPLAHYGVAGEPRLYRPRELLGVLATVVVVTVGACSDRGTGGPPLADQWTMLGYDLASSYHNPAQQRIGRDAARDLRPLWQLTARGQVYGTPVVVGDVVYANSTGGLYALDGGSGAVLWERADVRATSSLAYRDGTLFVHDLGANLRALDAATGEQRWQVRTDTHALATGLSSPIVLDRHVVVGISSNEIVREGATFHGGVAAFDAATGAPLWRDFTAVEPSNGASVWSTVAIDPETRVVFAGSGQNYTGVAGPGSDALFAIDLDTGTRLWTTQTVAGDVFTPINPRGPDADFGANPILFTARGRALVGAGQKNGMFWALDRGTGEVVWQRKLGPGSPLTGGVLNNGAFDGERILVACNDPAAQHGVLFALDPDDGAIVWERPLPGWVWAPITVSNGVGFVASDKDLHAFDVATGADLLVFPTAGTIACGASVVGGRVHFGSGMQHIVGTVDRRMYVLGLPDDPAGPGVLPTPTPPAESSFAAIYEEVFVGQGCTTPTCHGGAAGNLDLSTRDAAYAGLVDVPAAGGPCTGSGLLRVAPGDPDASLLWQKIATRTPPCGDPMPISAMLQPGDVARIRQWIERGALDD